MDAGQINGTPQLSTITTNQAAQDLSTHQLADLFEQVITQGAVVDQDKAGGYYMKVAAQPSAAEGTHLVKVDRELATAILGALKTGGRISKAETIEKILPEITDGGRYGQGEAVLARLLLAACDDRKKVMINGDRINITGPAEKVLNHELSSFWGTLGAKARWGADDPGVEPHQIPDQQPDPKAQDLVGANPQKAPLPKI